MSPVNKESRLLTSQALVEAAERGIETDPQPRGLSATYHRFIAEDDSSRKREAGKELIRAIFGFEAVLED